MKKRVEYFWCQDCGTQALVAPRDGYVIMHIPDCPACGKRMTGTDGERWKRAVQITEFEEKLRRFGLIILSAIVGALAATLWLWKGLHLWER